MTFDPLPIAKKAAALVALAGMMAVAPLAGAAAQTQDTLIVGVEADPASMEAARTMGLHNDRMVLQVFDTLVMLFGDTSELQPGLATSWEISDDGLQYTLALREGVKFHDGTPFNADAVVFTFERMLDENHPYYDDTFPWAGYYFGNVESIEALDDMTVRFTLKKPQSTFLTLLKHVSGGIVSPTAVEKWGDDFRSHPVGTGPFKFVEWEKGQRVVLEANEDYWRGAPKIKRVIFKPVPDPTARLNQLRSGEVHLMVAFPPEFIPEIEEDPNLTLNSETGAHTWWVAFNTTEPPFDDVRVREAVNYAVDKEAIVRDVLYGSASLSGGLVPGSVRWSSPEVEPYPYDPERAKELLAEAGYPDGFETDFLVPESGSGMIAPVGLATVIQAYLSEVGIEANLVTQEWNSYLETYQAGLEDAKAGMAEMSWMRDTNDPALFSPANLNCDPATGFFNVGKYCNEEVDALFEEAIATSDDAKKEELYRKIHEIIAEDAPWLFMFHANQTIASRNEVKGLVANPSFLVRLEEVYFEE
jgi:peptide/nickel transport system substrate-binding protein